MKAPSGRLARALSLNESHLSDLRPTKVRFVRLEMRFDSRSRV